MALLLLSKDKTSLRILLMQQDTEGYLFVCCCHWFRWSFLMGGKYLQIGVEVFEK